MSVRSKLVALLMTLGAIGVVNNGAHATSYNESASGDLSNSVTSPTALGPLTPGSNVFFGSLTGDPQDEIDVFSFVIPVGSQVTQLMWTYDLGGFDFSGNFFLGDASDNTVTVFNSVFGPSPLDVFAEDSIGPLNAGLYKFDIRAFGNSTGLESYRLDLTVVSATPLPATLPLMASGIGAIGLLGWRRKQSRKHAT